MPVPKTDLPTEAVADPQSLNARWWTDHPMTYDWNESTPEGSRPWFEEVDRRFLSAAYFAAGPNGEPFGREITPAFAAGKDVLEIGCGMGTHAALLARAGARLTAGDLTQPAVDTTRRRVRAFGLERTLEQADAEHLPFADASFDSIWSWGVLHHSSSFERCLSELARVHRSGGRLTMMVYHRRSAFLYLHQGLVRGVLMGQLRNSSLEEIYMRNVDGAYARLFTRSELRGLLAPTYENVELEVMGAKAELFPMPAGRLKDRLVAATPDGVASAVLGRVGFFLVARGVRRARA